ncbi:MAG: permease [Spirochaetales bacterium]|nr:permease [Spirochaetales bacterium]
MSYVLIPITLLLVIISFVVDRKKTFSALQQAGKRLLTILPVLLLVLILVSAVLYFVPEKNISEYLSNGNKYFSILVAVLIGSIALMPGFIAFPLSGVLYQNGVPMMVIAGFTTTLMMVGILTFPVEQKYFGTKVAVLRNVISLGIALVISLVIGIVFGEI